MGIIKLVKVALPAVALLIGAGYTGSAAYAAEFKIHKNYVKFNGHRYFKRNSTAVKLGTYGEKKVPATQQNYLDPYTRLANIGPTDTSPPQFAQSSSDFSASHNGNFAMPIKLAKLGIDSAGYMRLIKNQKCSFVREFATSKPSVISKLNGNSTAKNYLKQKNSGRIVYDLIRVKSCVIKNSTIASAQTDGKVSIAAIGLSLKGKDKVSGESTVEFAFGKKTVIGYRMYKMEWDKRKKSKRTRIVDLEDDGQSFN